MGWFLWQYCHNVRTPIPPWVIPLSWGIAHRCSRCSPIACAASSWSIRVNTNPFQFGVSVAAYHMQSFVQCNSFKDWLACVESCIKKWWTILMAKHVREAVAKSGYTSSVQRLRESASHHSKAQADHGWKKWAWFHLCLPFPHQMFGMQTQIRCSFIEWIMYGKNTIYIYVTIFIYIIYILYF